MTSTSRFFDRPIAHRGLHDARLGLAENSASAALAAIERGLSIECDAQVTAEGEALVFHDFTLERLTHAVGRVDARPARELCALPLRLGADAPLTLDAFVDLIGGRAPLICEIKSRFDGDLRLAHRVAQIARRAPGPIAIKSFDPRPIAELRRIWDQERVTSIPLGVVACQDFHDEEAALDAQERRALAAMLHWDQTRPDFLSFCVDDLPHAATHLARTRLGVPVMTWTVRTTAQAQRAATYADQIIFEGQEVL